MTVNLVGVENIIAVRITWTSNTVGINKSFEQFKVKILKTWQTTFTRWNSSLPLATSRLTVYPSSTDQNIQG